ncbi:MAG: HTTM domain-containing protein [Flavobacteriaceae bacterium]|nr:HTTM domain-containing protein [Flavobacteriaceae bacterium]
MNKFLFQRIDNTGLVLWRGIFGLLITLEAFGAIATGWVKNTLVDPQFTFNFIGFDFLQPLPGTGMYYYFALMGIFGILVTFGYRYRFSMFCYALMWTCVYLMQKTAYNNHYYLMMLLCWLMVFLPANSWWSLDAKKDPSVRSISAPRWTYLVIIFQVWIIYTYAAIAKIYPDWLDGTVAAYFMKGKADYWLIGDLLQFRWVHMSIAYFGIFFDLLIVPLLLWKKTRVTAFWISVFFHLFNSIVFQIGIFPYMSIAFALFFFSSETLQKVFLRNRPLYREGEVEIPKYKSLLLIVFSTYFLVQLLLPLRHWTFKDDVLWTEEGHRLAWRMMLRAKSGLLSVYVVNKKTGLRNNFNYNEILSQKQRRSVKTKPDLIWQLVQRIKQMEADRGNDVEIYVVTRVRVNGGAYFPLIDPNVDLANEVWQHFRHHEWILSSPEDYHNEN